MGRDCLPTEPRKVVIQPVLCWIPKVVDLWQMRTAYQDVELIEVAVNEAARRQLLRQVHQLCKYFTRVSQLTHLHTFSKQPYVSAHGLPLLIHYAISLKAFPDNSIARQTPVAWQQHASP